MKHLQFPIRKGGIFSPGNEINGLREGVQKFHAPRGKPEDLHRQGGKEPFSRTETSYQSAPLSCPD
jgi:hypothetical protein